jgi:DNA polymerase III epsilon subunit-like protein
MAISKKIRTFALDTETTGLADDDEILSVGIVDETGSPVFFSYIRPSTKTEWPDAQIINGISPEAVQHMPTLDQILPAIQQLVTGNRVVCYGADFDTKFFPTKLAEAEVCCAMNAYRDIVGARKRLTVAAEHAGHEWTGNAHTALADAAAAMSVWHWCQEHSVQRQ